MGLGLGLFIPTGKMNKEGETTPFAEPLPGMPTDDRSRDQAWKDFVRKDATQALQRQGPPIHANQDDLVRARCACRENGHAMALCASPVTPPRPHCAQLICCGAAALPPTSNLWPLVAPSEHV